MHELDPTLSTSTRRDFLKKVAIAVGAGSVLASLDDSGERMVNAMNQSEFSTEPTWRQDFTTMPDGPIDNTIWRFELDPEVPGYNDEAQAYTSSERNVRIEDGRLVLEAHRESYAYPDSTDQQYEITSGRIDTKDSFSFEYGKFEATMKMPEGSGTWPAFWFLSDNQPNTAKLNPTEQDWAKPRFYAWDGELDAMEGYGANPGMVEGTVHTFKKSTDFTVAVPDASDNFHTYGVELTPDKIVWTLDGQAYGTFEKPSDNLDEWPFGNGNKLYAILNLAMGSAGGEVDPAKDSWRFEISDVSFHAYSPTQ